MIVRVSHVTKNCYNFTHSVPQHTRTEINAISKPCKPLHNQSLNRNLPPENHGGVSAHLQVVLLHPQVEVPAPGRALPGLELVPAQDGRPEGRGDGVGGAGDGVLGDSGPGGEVAGQEVVVVGFPAWNEEEVALILSLRDSFFVGRLG